MALGIYISVPFCRTKCTFCNFASDVFSKAVFDRYVDRVCADIDHAEWIAAGMGGRIEREVDSIYFGGGTPTVLDAAQLQRIFAALQRQFAVVREAEITVECAPGTLDPKMIETLLRCDVNRISLGVQSFIDLEAAAVGRKHNRTIVLDDIALLRSAGIANISLDLIAGLPRQTAESWNCSLAETIAATAPHVSVYMLEVDEDSRLGREVLAGGTRYHAHVVPDEDAAADFYLEACDQLQAAGISQYEISNFARTASESRHNLKYWNRQPYFGFGVDAHSMLRSVSPDFDAVRFSSADSLERYIAEKRPEGAAISPRAALEESLFLGLRLNRGINLPELTTSFGNDAIENTLAQIAECVDDGLMEKQGSSVRLTKRGRLLSNEVFGRFIGVGEVVH